MRKQILLSQLSIILCVALSQGSTSLSNNSNVEGVEADSLDHSVRKKRVIDISPNANTRVRRLQDVNYVVNVQKNGNHACAGSILAANVILAPATCLHDIARYTVVSGTILSRGAGTVHNVNGILIHPHFNTQTQESNIALVSIQQPFVFGVNLNQPISLYSSLSGRLPVNATVTVSGWGQAVQHRSGVGCILSRELPRFVKPNELRTITLRAISTEECRARFHNNRFITDDMICTFHEDKYCGPGDVGNPVVFAGRLVGMLVLHGFHIGPDISVNLALPVNRNWINENMSHIPRFDVRPPSPRGHRHRRPETCSKVHPC